MDIMSELIHGLVILFGGIIAVITLIITGKKLEEVDQYKQQLENEDFSKKELDKWNDNNPDDKLTWMRKRLKK